jgi:hypothetical protein
MTATYAEVVYVEENGVIRRVRAEFIDDANILHDENGPYFLVNGEPFHLAPLMSGGIHDEYPKFIRMDAVTGYASMDGMCHRLGGDCCPVRRELPCPTCRGRRHYQGAYFGMMELCESCDRAEFNAPPPTDPDGMTY